MRKDMVSKGLSEGMVAEGKGGNTDGYGRGWWSQALYPMEKDIHVFPVFVILTEISCISSTQNGHNQTCPIPNTCLPH